MSDDAKDIPRADSVWRHRNGNQYYVLCVANIYSERPEYPLTVVYVGANGRIWSRPFAEWHRSMTEEVF